MADSDIPKDWDGVLTAPLRWVRRHACFPSANGTRVRSEKRRQLRDRESHGRSCETDPGAEAVGWRSPVETEEPNRGGYAPKIRFSAIRLPGGVGVERNTDLRGHLLLVEPARPSPGPEGCPERAFEHFRPLVTPEDRPTGGKCQMTKRHRRNEVAVPFDSVLRKKADSRVLKTASKERGGISGQEQKNGAEGRDSASLRLSLARDCSLGTSTFVYRPC